MNRGHTVEQVLTSYCEYLQSTFGDRSDQLKRFVDRINADEESPRSEAVIFTWLSNIGLNPTVNEDPSRGGIDFLCLPPSGHKAYVEVHSIGSKTMGDKTGFDLIRQRGGGAFGMPTNLLQARIKSKWDQLANAEFPRVLVITSEHPMAGLVLGPESAQHLFISTPKIMVPFDAAKPAQQIADLENSAFLELADNGTVLPKRKFVSAVVLAAIQPTEMSPIGLLHPEPAETLNIDDWYQVPFMYLHDWPLKDGKVNLDWTMPPELPPHAHQRLRLAKQRET